MQAWPRIHAREHQKEWWSSALSSVPEAIRSSASPCISRAGLVTQPSLWDEPLPRIRIEAPSAPGSETSRDAADAIEPFRRRQWRLVLVALSKLPAGALLSREEIAARTGIKECSLCGRLSDRELCLKRNATERMWVEVIPDALVASSNRRVDGYRLTTAGRDLFKKRATTLEDRILEENNAIRKVGSA